MSSSPASPIRVGLIGLGDIGVNQHLPALLRSERVQLDAVADVSEDCRERATHLLHGTDTAIFADAERVLDRELDAVVIATPPWVTPKLSMAALERGRFVLAEKPVATGRSEAQALLDMPASWRAKYQLGLTYRHDFAIERLRDELALGELGDGPFLIHASIYDEANRVDDLEHSERIRSTLGHGDPSMHEGAHVFDWLSAILGTGPDDVVDAWSVTTIKDAPAPNIVGARLNYPGGTVANVEFGWLLDVLPPGFIRITGALGSAELGLENFDLTITTVTGSRTLSQDRPKMERCFDRQLDSFLDLVEGRVDSPSVGVEDGVSTLVIAEQISALFQRQQQD